MKKIRILILMLLTLSPTIILAQPAEKTGTPSALEDFSRMSEGDKNLILGGMGMPSTGGFNWMTLVGNVLFSSIGFVAFIYGKKNQFYKTMTIGLIMMVYPYIISNLYAMFGIGIGLCIALYYFRD